MLRNLRLEAQPGAFCKFRYSIFLSSLALSLGFLNAQSQGNSRVDCLELKKGCGLRLSYINREEQHLLFGLHVSPDARFGADHVAPDVHQCTWTAVACPDFQGLMSPVYFVCH